jgi:hypothetical protein
MKATKQVKEVQPVAKPVAAKKTLTHEERSAIARKAAHAAHATMKSKRYLAAKAKSPKAVAAYLASRAA